MALEIETQGEFIFQATTGARLYQGLTGANSASGSHREDFDLRCSRPRKSRWECSLDAPQYSETVVQRESRLGTWRKNSTYIAVQVGLDFECSRG